MLVSTRFIIRDMLGLISVTALIPMSCSSVLRVTTELDRSNRSLRDRSHVFMVVPRRGTTVLDGSHVVLGLFIVVSSRTTEIYLMCSSSSQLLPLRGTTEMTV